MKNVSLAMISVVLSSSLSWAAKPAPASSQKAPAVATDAGHASAPTVDKSMPQKQGEMSVDIKGKSREKMVVGKFDPPAAFNLEDIQNFPEDRLLPVLNNPVTFEEGRDFSNMMDFHEDRPVHPWLADLAREPYLRMKTPANDRPKEWTFSVIDQAGSRVYEQEGKGGLPDILIWNGQDNKRDHLAVDTVYIPQIATVDKDGYHHTLMGQPVQYGSFIFKDQGKTVIELSAKKLFQENKAELTKEAPLFLDKVCDQIKEDGLLPFSIQPYDDDMGLAQSRQRTLVKYFADKLVIPESQIVSASPAAADKRGSAMAIVASTVPGGSAQ